MKELKSTILSSLLDEIDPLDQAKTDAKMEIAAKIADAMKAKKWKKKDLLDAVGKSNPSIITKWLSGTHNFTTETLVELEHALNIKLINKEEKELRKIEYRVVISQEINRPEKNSFFNEIMLAMQVNQQKKTMFFPS